MDCGQDSTCGPHQVMKASPLAQCKSRRRVDCIFTGISREQRCPGLGQSREPHFCRRPFLFGAIKPLPPGAASVHGTLAGASPGTDAGALPVPGPAPSIRAQQGARGWGADQGGLLGLWGRGQPTRTRSRVPPHQCTRTSLTQDRPGLSLADPSSL